MQIRIPTLSGVQLPPPPHLSKQNAVELLADFLAKGKGKTLVLTGAGVSVDSGIRAYRGKHGSYTVNKKHRPIFYGEFVASEPHRRRYWARSFLGYLPVRHAKPNPTHFAVAALQKMGLIQGLITQNVDGLHHKSWDTSLKAYSHTPTLSAHKSVWKTPSLVSFDPPILELHGTLRHAGCVTCGTMTNRDAFQDKLAELNPEWQKYSEQVEEGREERLNPDGDVELGPGVKYEDFVVPPCDSCGGIMKPQVIFFGESLSHEVRERSLQMVAEADQILVAGSSLATFSAFRLVRQTSETSRPVGIINVGETRGDPLATWRIGREVGDVLPGAAEKFWQEEKREDIRKEVEMMLKAGEVKLPSSKHATMVVSLASNGGAARIYTVNGGGQSSKSASAWLEAKIGDRKKRKGGQGGTGGEGEIRLIQDFDFPEASNKIRTTRDGQYVIATGTYKPRMKVFDLEELSMKTERVTDSENVDFCILSSDWTKTLHLQSDRSLELHTQASAHYSVRMPKHGRTLAYHFPSAEALVGGQGADVWRMNLEIGRFMKPFSLEGSAEGDGGEAGGYGGGEEKVIGVNAVDINPAHQLLSFGTETAAGRGTVEMWDPRSRTRAALLRLPYGRLMAASGSSASLLLASKLPGVDNATGPGVSVTALASKFDGLNLAVGTSTGHTLLYDLRANRPYMTKDQGYGLPIKKIEWVNSGVNSGGDSEAEGGWVSSIDEKVVKIWGKETGTNLVSINPPMPINDMHIYPSTGLMFLANETSPMTGYYIPQLGPAPKWCRFLDNMTEEMEEGQEVLMYDDYKFVDRQELDSLNLTHLIGTDTLKPYMHGYFIDLRLYTKARAIANPFAYAEHRERLVREKLEKEQESRIRGAKVASGSKLPEGVKVNRSLAKKATEAEERSQKRAAGEEDGEGERKRKRKAAAETPSLLKDSRFGDLFTNPDFQIDESSREFQLLNPSTKPKAQEEDAEDGSDAASDDGSESDYDSDSSQEGDLGFDNRKGFREPIQRRARDISRAVPVASTSRPKPSLVVAGDSDDDSRSRAARPATTYEDRASKTFGQRAREVAQASTAFGDEDEEEWNPTDIIRGAPGGGMEMSFIPSGPSEREKATTKAKDSAKTKSKSDKGQYGAGLENRADSKDDEEALDGEEGSGRQKMRKGVRSASRNVVRQLK